MTVMGRDQILDYEPEPRRSATRTADWHPSTTIKSAEIPENFSPKFVNFRQLSLLFGKNSDAYLSYLISLKLTLFFI